MRTWIRPAAAAENYLVNQSVSNGPCIAIACDTVAADKYENSKGLLGYNGGYNTNREGFVFHNPNDCGSSEKNSLIVVGGKIVGMKEIKNMNGANELNCTIYTDGTYSKPATNLDFTSGNTIYWTTESDADNIKRVWHHQGLIQTTGHSSNHS